MHIDIVFVRHGLRDGKRDDLTAAGMQSALDAGRWLAESGIEVARYVHSGHRRTRLTAEQLNQVVPAEIRRRSGMPDKRANFIALCRGLLDERSEASEVGAVVLVGSGGTQRTIEKNFGGGAFDVPTDNRAAAFAMRWDDDTLNCVAVFPGRAPPTEQQ